MLLKDGLHQTDTKQKTEQLVVVNLIHHITLKSVNVSDAEIVDTTFRFYGLVCAYTK
jgi:hypothetical protein